MGNLWLIIILIAMGILFVFLTFWMFFSRKNMGKRKQALSPYQTDYEYEGLSNNIEVDLEEDEDEISYDRPIVKNKRNTHKIRRIVIIYGVWIVCLVSVLSIFLKPGSEELYIIYAGKFNSYDDIGVRLYLSEISQVKEPIVLFAPIDESNGVSSFDMAGAEVLSSRIEQRQADVLIIDQAIFESLKDELYILDDEVANSTNTTFLTDDGHIYGIEVTNDSNLFKEFTSVADHAYIVVYGRSKNRESALKCIKYYINDVD